MRKHLQTASKAMRKCVDARLLVKCPSWAFPIFEAYTAITAGGSKATQQAIRAWQDNYGVRLNPFEIDCITAITEVREANKNGRAGN